MTPTWHQQALCAEVGPEPFFAEHVGQNLGAGKALCQGCSVRAECLEDALAVGHQIEGIWGGLTETERRPLLKQRRAA